MLNKKPIAHIVLRIVSVVLAAPFFIVAVMFIWSNIASAAADRNSLQVNAHSGNYERVEKLLKNGKDPNKTETNVTTYYNRNALEELVYFEGFKDDKKSEGRHDGLTEDENKMMQLLIDNGADVDHANKERSGDTPLISAVYEKSEDTVKLLLKNKAKVNKPNDENITPLTAAVKQLNYETTEILVENGADINVTCKGSDGVIKTLGEILDSFIYDKGSSPKEVDKANKILAYLKAHGLKTDDANKNITAKERGV